MTPEELIALIEAKDLQALAEACAPLTEKERRKLARTINPFAGKRFAKELARGSESTLPSSIRHHNYQGSVDLATIALCSFTLAKGVKLSRVTYEGRNKEGDCALVRVLSDRRPEWIDGWIEKQLKPRSWGGCELSLVVLLTLIDNGTCNKPLTDDYVMLLAEGSITS